jgi:hypothetical protein
LKIFDCLPFFSEFEVLRLRMAYLEEVVDRFVVVEAHQTHAGKPKPLHLAGGGAPDLLGHPKLALHAVDLPVGVSDWARDQFQRDSLGPALAQLGAAPGDMVLISDVDEIPGVAALGRAREALSAAGERAILAFEQRLFYFRLNYELVWSRKLPWIGTAAVRFEHAASVNGVRTTARDIRGRHSQGFDARAQVRRVPEGGWHFSYIGDDAALEQKLAAHEEHGRKRRESSSIRELIAGRRSLFPRKGLEEVWAVMPPEAVGLPESVVASAGAGHLFESPPDSADDILRRVRAAGVPRRWRLGRFDLGYARRSPWPRLGED